MARGRRVQKNFDMIKEQDQDSRQVVWTNCPKCGDIWTTRAVAPKGKCPVCRGKVKIQKIVF